MRLVYPRKLSKQNRDEWYKLFEEFKGTELYTRTPSVCLFFIFQDWVMERYEAPNIKQKVK